MNFRDVFFKNSIATSITVFSTE